MFRAKAEPQQEGVHRMDCSIVFSEEGTVSRHAGSEGQTEKKVLIPWLQPEKLNKESGRQEDGGGKLKGRLACSACRQSDMLLHPDRGSQLTCN